MGHDIIIAGKKQWLTTRTLPNLYSWLEIRGSPWHLSTILVRNLQHPSAFSSQLNTSSHALHPMLTIFPAKHKLTWFTWVRRTKKLATNKSISDYQLPYARKPYAPLYISTTSSWSFDYLSPGNHSHTCGKDHRQHGKSPFNITPINKYARQRNFIHQIIHRLLCANFIEITHVRESGIHPLFSLPSTKEKDKWKRRVCGVSKGSFSLTCHPADRAAKETVSESSPPPWHWSLSMSALVVPTQGIFDTSR
jgi:hypothetical protein